jgi:septal ring factor EnvC (AmiA/AmiB activator)
MRNQSKTIISLLLLGFAGGVLGQGVFILRDHCTRLESSLTNDFRVLVFLKHGTSEGRRKIAQEHLLALPQTEDVVYVSPKDGLNRIEAEDPGFSDTVALLGENPLPHAFEAELSEAALSDLGAWVSSAQKIKEVADIRYKTLQAGAILQIRFYAHFLNLLLCFVFAAWAVAVAGLLWQSRQSGRSVLQMLGDEEAIAARCLYCGGGTAIGMLLASLIALPARSEMFSAIPGLGWELLLLAVSASVGAMLLPVISAFGGARGSSTGGARSSARLGAAVLAAVLMMPHTYAAAQTVRGKQKELSTVKSRLKAKQKEYRKSKKLESTLRDNLKKLKRREDRSQGQLRRLKKRSEKKEKEWRKFGKRLEALQTTRDAGLNALSTEVEEYRRDQADGSAMYGRSDLWKDAYRRAAIGEKTVYLARLGAFQSQVQTKHVAAQNEGRVLRARTSRTLSDLLGQRERVKRVSHEYSDVRKRVKMTRDEVRKLEENAKAIAALIKKLRKRAKKPYKATGKGPAFAKNSLAWPAAGPVLSTFGKKRVKELKTWVINNGIEIGAAKGSTVKAVASGEVIYAGLFRSYGRVVIVEHGKGFVSIYGQLGAMSRKTGERVSRGAPLGAAGAGDDGKGLLYLELRQGSDALNPLTWLKKR